MRTVDFATAMERLDEPGLIQALRAMYREGVDRVERLHLAEPTAEGANDWLLLPSWRFGRHFGAKLVSVFPANPANGLEAVQGIYALFDGSSGVPVLVVDGAALTLKKTACNSALAADLLARPDAATLLVLGSGALAGWLVRAHRSVRPYSQVLWWGRDARKTEAAIATCGMTGITQVAPDRLDGAVAEADVISCATRAAVPLVKGRLLKPGAHLDLVGGYLADMREADDAAAERAARHVVDARFTTVGVVGDLILPMRAGIITESALVDLFELCRGVRPGRLGPDEITWFKSGGGGHADLATAAYLQDALGRAS
ncbi:hypothetical protein [Geminicoccus roseus]|uniref:hypothetical protein n=1 Tax=Geminicoccus roseus TaxID=404900 RepID=UPI00041EDC81|nr:hypothetical protein [Geminicoccus roseus]